jgi:crotonobetainyl-CoA:carnitine CoA-transferase CaiB-like acyl-CoA transferase
MKPETGALSDIRIIDFSHVFQGPVGTQLLGDFGADVIKVERPGSGDWSRAWGPFVGSVSLPFICLNRNKRSVTLDLKNPDAKRVLLDLLKTADVLVHNFRPGVMGKLGLSYEAVSAVNPRLVYARSSGWGDEGPYVERRRGGHDVMARAAAGLFEPLGPDGLPVEAGISADYPAGLLLVIGILVALHARERTGRGQLVSTDLLSAAFHTNTWRGANALNRARIDSQDGIGASEAAIRTSFWTADGAIEISPVFTDDALRDLSVALGLSDLSQDPRFVDKTARPAHADEINDILAERLKQKSTAEWLAELEPKGILCTRVNTYAEAAEDPQLLANRMVVELALPGVGSLRVLGTPIRLYDTPASRRLSPPVLGEHTVEVLQGLGYSQNEIDSLRERGVFGEVC